MKEWTSTSELQALSERLTEISIKQLWLPHEVFEFPDTVDPQAALYLSPELSSLAGTPFYENASDAQKRRLSFYEAVNFFSLNIHGEKALLQGLVQRLYESKDPTLSSYLHHFVDEENKHMVLFGTFCTRYAGKVYPERKLLFPREYADGEEDFLFFARVMIFEELVDVYNRKMASDDRLHPLARAINDYHHRDEVRHLAFGRQLVRELWRKHQPSWSKDTVAKIRSGIEAFIAMTWREYYNPDVYSDAGAPEAYDLAEAAYGSPAQIEHRRRIAEPCIRHLLDAGVLLQEPNP